MCRHQKILSTGMHSQVCQYIFLSDEVWLQRCFRIIILEEMCHSDKNISTDNKLKIVRSWQALQAKLDELLDKYFKGQRVNHATCEK